MATYRSVAGHRISFPTTGNPVSEEKWIPATNEIFNQINGRSLENNSLTIALIENVWELIDCLLLKWGEVLYQDSQ